MKKYESGDVAYLEEYREWVIENRRNIWIRRKLRAAKEMVVRFFHRATKACGFIHVREHDRLTRLAQAELKHSIERLQGDNIDLWAIIDKVQEGR